MANVTFETFAPPAWMAELESVINELSRSTPEERLREDTTSVEIPGWREAVDTWSPSHSMGNLLRYSIRPQIYLIQFTVDPDFTLSPPFPRMRASLSEEVRGAIRRVLDQLVRTPFRYLSRSPFGADSDRSEETTARLASPLCEARANRAQPRPPGRHHRPWCL